MPHGMIKQPHHPERIPQNKPLFLDPFHLSPQNNQLWTVHLLLKYVLSRKKGRNEKKKLIFHPLRILQPPDADAEDSQKNQSVWGTNYKS